MDECKLVLIGFGAVGQGVARAISMKKEMINEKFGVNLKIVAAGDSSVLQSVLMDWMKNCSLKLKRNLENWQIIRNMAATFLELTFWMPLTMTF